ncbi:nuclear factor 7, ovary-like [Anomaloglossus baeobatrachus]|uniref:nuclear factor 7, ovary-like n=1 Tax=Anomaloglossus baeobatrachus TaxID=238106 RepID=UPI003F503F08
MACALFGDKLLCSICLSAYEDPVPLRCGHYFCRVCIEMELETQEGSEDFTCPDCKVELQERPPQPENVTPSSITEGFLSTGTEQQVCAGLFCTYCIHAVIPAVKSCLHCEALLCDSHLKVHNKSEEHMLTDPIVFKESKRCPIHDKVLQYYCPKDATCICLLCRLAGDHIGHPVEQLKEATKKKKKKLRNVQKKMIQRKGKIEEKLQRLKEQQKESHKETAGEMEKVTALFRNIRSKLDDLETKVLTHYVSRQDNHGSFISDLIRKMEKTKDEIYSKISHLEVLCNINNPWPILQEPLSSQEDVIVAQVEATLVESKELQAADGLESVVISEMLYKGFTDIMIYAKKNIFSHEETDLFLDSRTAGINLEISDDLKMASWSQIKQIRPGQRDNLERCQVLSTSQFSSGRHFWDVETSKSGTWSLGVCYLSMPKSGDVAKIGSNNKSWCLSKFHNSNQYSVAHNDNEVLIEQKNPNNKFRLYLDYEAGQLFFYELTDPIRLLHVVTTKFKEPLRAAFYVCNGWVRIA